MKAYEMILEQNRKNCDWGGGALIGSMHCNQSVLDIDAQCTRNQEE